MFQIAQIQTELYFVLCCITIFCAQQRIQQRIMGVDYRRSAGAVTPATGKKPPALRLGVFMPVVGVEPTRYHYQWILSPHRLPFRHTGTSVDVQQHYYSGFPQQNQAVFFLFSRASYGSGRSPPCAGLFTSRFTAGLFRKYPLFPARVCAVFCPAPVLPRCAPGRSIAVSYIPLSPHR